MPAASGRRLIGLALPPGPRFAEALDEAWSRGDAVLPLDPAAPASAVAGVVEALAPDVVVDAAGTTETGAPVTADAALEAAAVVIATSGSTGRPKGACLSHEALEASARATADHLGIGQEDSWVSCLPWHHIGGLQVLLRARLLGTPMTVAAGAREAVEAGASLVSLVPAQLAALLDAGADISGWRAILLGGAAAPPALLDRARDAGGRVVTTYGMSETCGGCVYDGQPLTGVTVSAGADGRLAIAGPVVMTGYRLDPVRSGEVLRGGAFLTSDLGHVGPDGRVTVVGRADDVIVTGGENVPAAAVESVLAAHPDVADVAVVGVPDERFGQRVVAVVVWRSGPGSLDALKEWVAARAPRSHLPRGLVAVDALPRLGSGKTDRLAVRRLAAADPA